MAVYVILNNEVHDAQAYKAYLEAAPAFVKKYGGEYLVRGGDFEVMAGNWTPTRLVIFRYPNRDALKNMLNDPDYQPWKKVREAATSTHNLVVVDGV
jgi:uncharacterized protein (DUF1330 family)